MNKLIAPCGIDCSECTTYIATQANDDTYREAAAKRIREQYKISINKEDINCLGCLEPGKHIGYCAVCKIRECSVQKDVESCAQCDTYPCEDLASFHKHAPEAKEYIEKLRKEL